MEDVERRLGVSGAKTRRDRFPRPVLAFQFSTTIIIAIPSDFRIITSAPAPSHLDSSLYSVTSLFSVAFR
jgi:hypothetical protein